MRNIDYYYYRATLLGAVLGMSLLALFHMIFNVALDTKEPEQPKSKFEVVDEYKDCDLLRWTDHQLADYKYFLYCPK